MLIPSYLVTLWALLFVSCGPTAAQSVVVFDFELTDTSLEGETNGLRADEQTRLIRLSDQLRQRLKESGRFTLLDVTPVAGDAQASNLQACGGCDTRLAKPTVDLPVSPPAVLSSTPRALARRPMMFLAKRMPVQARAPGSGTRVPARIDAAACASSTPISAAVTATKRRGRRRKSSGTVLKEKTVASR
jgi:hypothetical protein